ncbi:MAG TPA: alpha/beta fold hydrolase [Candidatus Babeliales bacterium]|nr:alpha/beta fold hydrolase [Candidatus Babeliales bacterium]
MIAGARVAGGAGSASDLPLVFVHGVGSTAAIWDYQLEAFGAGRLCTAIELRGNGTQKPDPDPTTITRAGYAQDVLTVADALRAQRFILIGCSLGGVVAFELWRRARHRIAAMVLLGTFARYPDGERVAQNIAAQAQEAGSMRAFGALRAAKLGLPPARLHETVEQYACKSVECFLAATQATWTGDYRDILPAIDVPTLVAYGEHDAIAPRSLAEEIACGIAGARLAMIPGAGHVANADDPPAFNALVKDFINRSLRGTASGNPENFG